MEYELLPLGSIVLLRDSDRKLMITGFLQKAGPEGEIWDYVGVLWPEGFLGPERTLVFQRENIESVYQMGFQNGEQAVFRGWICEKYRLVRDGKEQSWH